MPTMPNLHKYRAFPKIDLPDRTWPTKTIDKAPIWCSVDLRDGNQALIEPMNRDRKVRFFRHLLAVGFKEIEVGFPAASDTDFDFVRHIIENDIIPDDVAIQVLVQSREELIRRTFEAVKGAKNVIIHFYNSTSTVQRRVVFGLEQDGITRIAVDAAKLIRELIPTLEGSNVRIEYSPESFTGTELPYARDICHAVMDVFEPTPENPIIINLPATVEMASPNYYADQIEWMHRNLRNRDSVILSLHPHNDRGTAVAATELGVMAGADRIEGTLFGNGERTGNVDLVTLALNMFTQGVDPALDFSNITESIAVAEYCNQLPVHQRHPYAGELAYTAFSGSHQDAIKKGMAAVRQSNDGLWEVPYLPIDPMDVGRAYEGIIRVNSQSGKGGTAYIMENDFGVELPRLLQVEFSQVVQKIADTTGKEILPAMIWQSFEDTYLETTEPFELVRYKVTPGSGDGMSAVEAEVIRDGETVTVAGEENGPISAFFQGMKDAFGIRANLTDYREHAIHASEKGSRTRAVCFIRLANRHGEQRFGVGIDENTTTASLKAIVSALNRLAKV
ncbi:2-isopropylmalate synthase [Minwuia thermotolerans]|uniref:2-isopropylmalate synthase n=2 Tax=Minwuia thermotolerans TaxID=2056226 RepID=A0A2M9FYS1_9PROT|nr:2-isopropylmalate synthase [Minwuia thermotolerans]PJK28607.1 2-isopropylmalate synthase [Minwuia thermotolerans]